jgi:hypothetical protein
MRLSPTPCRVAPVRRVRGEMRHVKSHAHTFWGSSTLVSVLSRWRRLWVFSAMTNRCLRPTVLLLGSERARVSRVSISLPDEHGEIDNGRDTGESECASSSGWEGAANGSRGWEGAAEGCSSGGGVASRACSCASLRRNSAFRLAFCDWRSMISFPYSLLSRSQVCHLQTKHLKSTPPGCPLARWALMSAR